MSKTVRLRMMAILCSLLVVLVSGSQAVKADFVFGDPERIPNVSRPGAGGPQISRDGLELYFWHMSPTACPSIWVAKRATTKEPWGNPVRLDPPLDSGGPVGGPCVSADRLELYFGDGHPESYVGRGCVANPNGYGGGDLWVSRRATKNDPWGAAENLGPMVNTASYEDHPCISADGLSLYFTSTRSGGADQYRLWVTTRPTKDAPWGWPVTIGAPVDNPYMFETTPFVSADGLSLYYSGGGYTPDIYVSKRSSTADPWGTPVLFSPAQSPGAEWHLSFCEEDSTVYFERADNFYAVVDLWQVKVTPVLDFNQDTRIDEKDFWVMTQHWDQNYSKCDIAPKPLGDGIVDVKDQMRFVEAIEGRDVIRCPGPHASEVARDVILRWTSPRFAKAHDVYFGTSLADVSHATRSDPRGVLVSLGQVPTAHDPQVLLSPGHVYYWRVDEIGGAPGFTLYPGPVLDFTTAQEPASATAEARMVTKIIPTASSSQPDTGPEKTVDSSGLDAGDGHSTDSKDMWQSTNAGPHWIQYEFDRVYALHELWVWNSNQLVEPFVGFGARTVKVEYSTDGAAWTTLEGVPEFAKAPGQPGYEADTVVSFGGASARYVRLTIEKGWGVTSSVGLSEVRFFHVPDRPGNQP